MYFEGPLLLGDEDGEIDRFEIRILLTNDFPREYPCVFEIKNRIPRVPSRHIYKNGMCCIGTPVDLWLLFQDKFSLVEYVKVPITQYFISQVFYEQKGEWLFGERSHGKEGIWESLFQIFGSKDKNFVIDGLLLLSRKKIKGHLACPCGSGKILRNCHQSQFNNLRNQMSPLRSRDILKLITEPQNLKQ